MRHQNIIYLFDSRNPTQTQLQVDEGMNELSRRSKTVRILHNQLQLRIKISKFGFE